MICKVGFVLRFFSGMVSRREVESVGIGNSVFRREIVKFGVVTFLKWGWSWCFRFCRYCALIVEDYI